MLKAVLLWGRNRRRSMHGDCSASTEVAGGGSVPVGYVSSLVVVSHPHSLHMVFTSS